MCLNPITVRVPHRGLQTVPCGKCVECIKKRSKEWSFRVVLEAKQFDANSFITLTYNEENKPECGLRYRDFQLFMKRLRKKIGKVRFFMCGEYGDKFQRPHYHVIIFGWYPDDSYYWKKSKSGEKLYRSPTLEKIWTAGFSVIGDTDAVQQSSVLYASCYMQKFSDFPKNLTPPFVQMSRRPGLGFNAIPENLLETDKIWLNGQFVRAPRYFLDVLSRDFPEFVEVLKSKRQAFNDVSLIENNPNIVFDWIDPLTGECTFTTAEVAHRRIELKERQEKAKKYFRGVLDNAFRLCYNNSNEDNKKGGDSVDIGKLLLYDPAKNNNKE